jgi:hypothetical protein
MIRHIVFRIIAGIVLLAAIAGLGFFAYQIGVAHGIAANIQAPAAQVIPYGHFMWFPGFGIFGLLVPLFLLFLAFGALRRLIWGPRWGMRYMRHGPMGFHGSWGDGVLPMFAEMHRRAHAADAAAQPDDKKPEQ